MKKLSLVAALAMGVASVGLVAPSANAAFTTTCIGEGGAVTIPGDLVVPAGRSCSLDGTVVQGNVRVAKDADLVVVNGKVQGNVVVNENAFLDAKDTEFSGTFAARESFGSLLTNATVTGAVSTISNTTDEGFLIISDSTLGAQVRATGGSLDLMSSSVATNVLGLDAEYTDLHDSVVGGRLQVDNNALGGVVCASEVYGDATYSGNQDAVQLGGTRANGGASECVGSNFFNKNVSINGTKGGVQVVGNIIRGNLSGTENDPAPIGSGNRVRGTVSGQFTTLGTPGAALQARSAKTASVASTESVSLTASEERVQSNRESAKQRLRVAQQDAAQAGKAF